MPPQYGLVATQRTYWPSFGSASPPSGVAFLRCADELRPHLDRRSRERRGVGATTLSMSWIQALVRYTLPRAAGRS